MKLFKTNNINVIEECRVIFGVTLLIYSLLILVNLSRNLTFSENFICDLFT